MFAPLSPLPTSPLPNTLPNAAALPTRSGSGTGATTPLPLLPVAGADTPPANDAVANPGGTAPARSPGSALAPADDAAATSGRTASQRGLRLWDPALHQQLSDAQQAQSYLDQVASQLQSLKTSLSAKLAGLEVQSSQLEAQLSQITSTWRERQTASAATIDAQLNYTSPEPARQRFSVRGLDLRTLRSAGRETLTFSVAGSGSGPMTVNVDPAASVDVQVQRFEQALAPAGVDVALDDSGALVFSVAEAAWPSVRDSLAIKGDGVRFPTGQMHLARTDAEPAAIQPDTWKGDNSAALRQALQQVVQALERIKHARSAVSHALAEAAQQVERARTVDSADAAAALAQDFEATGNQPGFQAFSSVASALLGVSRTRVQSLLALPAAH